MHSRVVSASCGRVQVGRCHRLPAVGPSWSPGTAQSTHAVLAESTGQAIPSCPWSLEGQGQPTSSQARPPPEPGHPLWLLRVQGPLQTPPKSCLLSSVHERSEDSKGLLTPQAPSPTPSTCSMVPRTPPVDSTPFPSPRGFCP